MKKLRFLFTFVLLLLTGMTLSAETKFDFNKPEGTYVITDYIGRKITVKLQPFTSNEYNGTIVRGPGTLSVGGKTARGTWERLGNDNNIRFELSGGLRFRYNTPSGPGPHYQILIFDDGTAAGSIPEWSRKDTMNVKKVSGKSGSKASGKSKKKKRK